MIEKLVIRIGDKVIELKAYEARMLRSELDDLLGYNQVNKRLPSILSGNDPCPPMQGPQMGGAA